MSFSLLAVRPFLFAIALIAIGVGPVQGANPLPARIQGARKIVAALRQAARENARQPRPRRGDALTMHYIRVAAQSARGLPARQAPGAFLLALGIALDDSTILRNNLLTSHICKQVESAAERKARLAVIGKPTLHGRRDWCQHFVVSCALTELVGANLAETAGLLKEQRDMRKGGSGFSFADLCADLAGVIFASELKNSNLSLATLARRFQIKDYMPDPRDLPEGLSEKRFTREYGSVTDKRFRKKVEAIRQQVRTLPGHKMKGK